jgi:hypothetical protein
VLIVFNPRTPQKITPFSQSRNFLYFWCTHTQLEVDFIIYGPRGFWAIEVKHGKELGTKDLRGLSAFKEEYPEAQCMILNSGTRREEFRGFPVLPIREFLMKLSPESLNRSYQQPNWKSSIKESSKAY